MVTLRRALTSIFLLLVVHGLAILSGWYENNRWFDIPMHFLGGVVIALLALAIWNLCIQKITFQPELKSGWRFLVYVVGILGFVAIVGIAWEWYEFLFDNLVKALSYNLPKTQMSIGDTMVDLLLDIAGGLTAFLLFRNRPQQ
ncbi:MAG: hypothetical protein AAB776_03180 [Patescibacteria group bacterium]